MARTGSGKTACFLIPMFERLKARSAQSGARALVLSPTRELALQTMKFTKEVRDVCVWLRGRASEQWRGSSGQVRPLFPPSLFFSFSPYSWANSLASRLP